MQQKLNVGSEWKCRNKGGRGRSKTIAEESSGEDHRRRSRWLCEMKMAVLDSLPRLGEPEVS